MNVDLMKKLGWDAKTKLKDGIASSYRDYLSRHNNLNK